MTRMRLKRARDIEWQDLPNIESPFHARIQIEERYHHRHGLRGLKGIDEILRDKWLKPLSH